MVGWEFSNPFKYWNPDFYDRKNQTKIQSFLCGYVNAPISASVERKLLFRVEAVFASFFYSRSLPSTSNCSAWQNKLFVNKRMLIFNKAKMMWDNTFYQCVEEHWTSFTRPWWILQLKINKFGCLFEMEINLEHLKAHPIKYTHTCCEKLGRGKRQDGTEFKVTHVFN